MKMATITNGLKKHSPAILTGLAIAGTIGAVVSAIIARPKYDKIIDERKAEAEKKNEELTKKDILVAGVKAYWPTLLLIVASAGCAIGSNYIGYKRVVGAMAAAASTKKLYDDYVEAAASKLKPKQVEEISDEIAKKRMNDTFKNMKPTEKILNKKYSGPKDGEQLLYDCWLGKAFYGDPREIERKFVEFKDAYFNYGDNDIRLESFYLETDIPFENVPAIKYSGWSIGAGMPSFKWVPIAIEEGPYAGETCWGLQWHTNSEPTNVII